MNLSILLFPDSYEVYVPYGSSSGTPQSHLTGKLCIVTSRAIECQAIELELRGDLLVDHRTSFDVLNNLIEGMPPPVVHIHHEIELPIRKFEIGHTIVDFSMPLSKRMPPSYEGSYVFVEYSLCAKMRYRKWMTTSSVKSSICNLKIKPTSLDPLGSFPLKSHLCSIEDKLHAEIMTPSAAVAGGEKVPIQLVVRNGTPVGPSITIQVWQVEKSSSFVSGPKKKHRLQYETRCPLSSLEDTFYLSLPNHLTSAFKTESNCAKAEVYHLIKFIMSCAEFDSPVCVDVPIKVIGVSNQPTHHHDAEHQDRLPVYEERDRTLPAYEWLSSDESFQNTQVPSTS